MTALGHLTPTLQVPSRNMFPGRKLVVAQSSGWGKTPPHPSLGGAGRVPWDAAPLPVPIPSLGTHNLSPSVPLSRCSVK